MAKMDPEEVERRLKAEAERENMEKAAEALRDRKMDDAFMGDFYDLFGVNPSDVAAFQRDADKAAGVSKEDIDEALRVINKAKKQRPEKARKTLRNSAAVGKVAGAAKKGKGCAVIAVLLLAIGGSSAATVIYGAAELVSALVR